MSDWLFVRYVLDRALALVLAVGTVPVTAVLAFLVWWEDGARPIISLPRVGRSGRQFKMWKVRTMSPSRPGGAAVGSALTTADDHRITRVGRPLRRWRLDEIPQLWNVVRGEMALIGPRPEAPDFVDRTDLRWSRVLSALPGIAGPTQLLVHQWEAEVLTTPAAAEDRYRAEILPVKLAIDAWYVRNATLRLDAALLFDLLEHLAFGRSPRRVSKRVLAGVPLCRNIPATAATPSD